MRQKGGSRPTLVARQCLASSSSTWPAPDIMVAPRGAMNKGVCVQRITRRLGACRGGGGPSPLGGPAVRGAADGRWRDDSRAQSRLYSLL